MSKLQGTETLKNLMKSFAGESQARNRYAFFASVAKKEGYNVIESIFTETADNEKEHAKLFYKHLARDLKATKNFMIEITASYPVELGSTYDNLISAAEGEREEWQEIYRDFANVADAEGLPEVAATFRDVALVEAEHEQRYRDLAAQVQNGTVFKRNSEVEWKCRNCGYVHTGNEAPAICPCCNHAQAYFEVRVKPY